MQSNAELLLAQVNLKIYFEHILDLKIEIYLKDKGSNTSMLNHPYNLKLLYMKAFNQTNDAYEQLGSNQQLIIEECKDDIDMIDREINIYFHERGQNSDIIICAQI